MSASAAPKDLTQGNIRSQLWSLSWPMMLSMFFHTLYNLVDAYWVGKISPESIAAVSVSQITLFMMISLGFGITAGSGVVMSMDIGAKNKEGAERVLGQSFVLTAMLGVLFTAVALIFQNQLLTLSGATGDIFEPAVDYFTVTAGGSILFFILVAIMFAFNAQGDTFTLTKLFAVSTLINLVLDPILIFGKFGFPELGISGAAYATLFSQFVFIVIALRSLSSPKRSIQFHFRNLSFRWESVKRVLKIGIPAALTQLINPLGVAALNWVSGKAFYEAGVVAFSLGFRIEFFAYLPAVGFGFGAMAMVGQSIGAKNIQRAKDVLKTAMIYGMSIACVLGILAAIFAPYIIGAFTDDPLVTEYTLSYFYIVTFSYAFLAALMVESSTFQALGHSWPGFWITFLRFGVVTIPLSYFLAVYQGWSIQSIWWALFIGNVVGAFVGHFWLRAKMNAFKLTEVDETVHAT